jgi:hypothetical protein
MSTTALTSYRPQTLGFCLAPCHCTLSSSRSYSAGHLAYMFVSVLDLRRNSPCQYYTTPLFIQRTTVSGDAHGTALSCAQIYVRCRVSQYVGAYAAGQCEEVLRIHRLHRAGDGCLRKQTPSSWPCLRPTKARIGAHHTYHSRPAPDGGTPLAESGSSTTAQPARAKCNFKVLPLRSTVVITMVLWMAG